MSEPLVYSQVESNLSAAWSRAYLRLSAPPERELSPCMVSISANESGKPDEDDDLRHALDAALEETGQQSVEKVAKSIFPQAMWNRSNGDRHKLFADYRAYMPDFVAMEPNKNCHGIYFGRLIGYGLKPKDGSQEAHLPAELLKAGGNQLEYIIGTCKPGAQRMALQASIYDPVRDQTPARRGFPCLQHLSFAPDFKRKTLALNAFYATQQLFIKAYGNWLGLFRLGAFVAGETGLRFERLNCFTGIQKMEQANRPKAGDISDRLTDLARACVEEADGGARLRTEEVCSASQ